MLIRIVTPTFFIPTVLFFALRAPEKPSHEPAKERREVVEEKIKEAEKKAKEAERKVRIINEQIKSYQEKINDKSSSESAKETWRKGIKEAEKDKHNNEVIQQEEEEKVKSLEQEKKEIEALQKKLEDELVSVDSSSKENPLAERLRSCIEKKIIALLGDHVDIKILKELSKALQQLVSYEHITFANSNSITLADWSKIREQVLATKNYSDPKYQTLIQRVFQLREQVEKEFKEFKQNIFEAIYDCVLNFFVTEDKKLDDLTNYDG